MLDYPALRAVAAVVQTGSFEKAARVLNVTPSAISQRVKQLEERLGAVLIERGSPCIATEQGEWLCRHMDNVGMLEGDCSNICRARRSGRTETKDDAQHRNQCRQSWNLVLSGRIEFRERLAISLEYRGRRSGSHRRMAAAGTGHRGGHQPRKGRTRMQANSARRAPLSCDGEPRFHVPIFSRRRHPQRDRRCASPHLQPEGQITKPVAKPNIRR